MAKGLTDIRLLVRVALLAALVAAVTLGIRIPMPATEGYINVGDAVIIAAGLLYGGLVGGLAGGFGSAMADVLGGYSHWAPFTLFIKGFEGLFIGAVALRLKIDLRRPVGLALGGLIGLVGTGCMVSGYFLVEYYLYSLGPALASLPGNGIQALASLICGLPLAAALKRRGARRDEQKALD
jgi:uncharacterized membrane protein